MDGSSMTSPRSLLDLIGFAEVPPPPDVPVAALRAPRKARKYRDAQVSLLRVGPTGDGGQIAEERPEYVGWEEELNTPQPMTWPACRPPDGSPCPRVACRHHMRLDFPLPVGERIEGNEPWLSLNRQDGRIEVGRRPALTPAERGAAVDEFINEAADLDEMRATCVLVEIEKRGAMQELEVAELLGVDPETVRRETVSALEKLRALANGEGSGLPEDGLHAMLAALR